MATTSLNGSELEIPQIGLVAMTTNYVLSSDWSRGLVHNMNDICIRGSIVSRQKCLQPLYWKFHIIQVLPETLTLNES